MNLTVSRYYLYRYAIRHLCLSYHVSYSITRWRHGSPRFRCAVYYFSPLWRTLRRTCRCHRLSLFDLVMGHSAYTLFSIVIKGISGLVVGYMIVGFRPNPLKAREATFARLLSAMLVGAVWTALGYLVAWAYVLDSFMVAVGNLPASFLTSGIGIVVALFLVKGLRNIIR